MKNVAYNSIDLLNSPTTMTRKGYDFVFCSVNGTEVPSEIIYYNGTAGYDHKAGHLSTVDGATVVLYANWKPKYVKKIEIARGFTKYNYMYNEEIDFSSVRIWIRYEDSTADRLVSYNSEEFHYRMSYENGQVEREGVNGRDIPGTGIEMTIYYGPGRLNGAVVEDTFTISRATVDVTAPEPKVCIYDRTEKVLVNEGSIINSATGEEVVDMHFEYSVNGGAYTEELPEGTDVGIYNVAWQIVVDSDKTMYYDLPEILKDSFTSAIQMAAIITEPTAKTLTYNGSTQTLLNEGSVKDGDNVVGKIQYSTTSADATDFSDTIPSVTDAGSYKVYWKAIITDANYWCPDYFQQPKGSLEVIISLPL